MFSIYVKDKSNKLFYCDRMSVVIGDGWQLVLNVQYGVFCVWVQVVRVLIVTC